MVKVIDSGKILGLNFEHRIGPAAGISKNIDGTMGIEDMAKSAAAWVMGGSYTGIFRPGNTGNVYFYDPKRQMSVNFLGMPNKGMGVVEKEIPRMKEICAAQGKPLFISVAGFSPRENVELAKRAFAAGADVVEINCGCPNVMDAASGVRHNIASFELGILEETFRILKEEIGEDKPVLVKISPFTEPVLLGEVADLLAKTKAIKGVSTQNTVPNTLILDENGKSVITSGDGFGGGAGPAVFHSALGQVARLRQNFTKNNRPDMIICGAGGVATYVDAQRMLDKGADIVMVNTMVQERGLKFFGEVLSEYVEAESV